MPIVLLILWVALCFFWQPPWTPQYANDVASTFAPEQDSIPFHKVLILSSPTEKPQSLLFEAKLLDSAAWYTRIKPLNLYFPKNNYQSSASSSLPKPGDVILCHCRITEGRAYVPHGHYARLEHRSLRQVGWTQGKMRMLSLKCRDAIERRIQSFHMSEREEALIFSLVLADRRALSRDQREAFTDAGAMHVLAVSGLHVGIIAQIAIFLFTLGGLIFIPWEQEWLRIAQRLGILSLVWAYAFLTGMTISVVRSAIMFSLLPLGNLHIRTTLRYNRIATAAFLILLFDPSALYAVSFLLSFSAVLAIMYFIPYWQDYFPIPRKEWAQALQSKAFSLIGMSIAAQIGTLPWTLLFFGQSANYFLLTNLIVLPLASCLICLFLIAVCCSFLPFAFLSTGSMWLLEKCAWLMNSGVEWVQSLPGATSFFTFTPLMTVLLILFIIFSSAFIRTKEKKKYFYLLLSVCLAAALLFTYAHTIRSYVAVESALSLLSPS